MIIMIKITIAMIIMMIIIILMTILRLYSIFVVLTWQVE